MKKQIENNKKITIDDLAILMKRGFAEQEQKIDERFDEKIEQFAIMVKNSFDGVNRRFDGVDERFDGVEKRLNNLEKGQEEIRLRLDNVAFRFEVVDVQKRVGRLEKIVLKNKI